MPIGRPEAAGFGLTSGGCNVERFHCSCFVLILMFRAFLAICAIENGPKLLMGASPAGSTPTLSAHISY
jgi:hypothetical protein